jgi:UDP-N-acetylmuramoyl-tripeptide--D-alanyl-D-alanine ligase
MLTMPLELLAEVTRGQIIGEPGEVVVNGLAVDSRSVEPGNVFVAFPGEHTDGHGFLAAALEAGARALLITDDPGEHRDIVDMSCERGVGIVRVQDALQAVQDLARYHRDRLFCPVVGVTGSTGKTTTKEFMTSVLGSQRKVVATHGNRNNELGVPLTVLDAGADTDVLIVEMAMRGTGQIAELCEIAAPTLGLVTNVGTSHIELLGSCEAIADAKGELVEAIPEDGKVFLNGDDGRTIALADKSAAEVITYGVAVGCDVRAEEITVDDQSLVSFELAWADEAHPVALRVPGRHNIYNALAAAAVGLELGLDVPAIVTGLESAEAGDMRMQSFESATGVTVINDAYNANPTSMRAAIETLAGIRSARERIAVLGDMAELGSLTELAHFRLGEEIARQPIEFLVTVGPRATRIADGARAEGMTDDFVRVCKTAEEARDLVCQIAEPGDVVLVKASRVMGLERVVEGIVGADV